MMISASIGKKKEFRLGVSGKMILNVAVPTAAILLILAIIVTTIVVNTVWGLKNKDMTNQMQTVSTQITQYFEPFFTSQQFVMDYPSIQQLFQEMEQSPATYRFENSPNYPQTVRDLQYADTIGGDAVQGVWIAGIKNNEVFQSDGYITDSSFEITERTWYQSLQSNTGKSSLSPAYEDAASGGIVVTIVRPYYNNSGEMIGVVGIDLSMDLLMGYLSQISIGESGYVTVYDSNQNLIYHPDSSVLMTNLKDISYSTNMKELLEQQQTSDIVKYQRSGSTYYGGTLYIDEFGWSVLACMPGNEYMRETTVIFLILAIGFSLCILITSLVCLVQTRALVKPLKKIGRIAGEFAKGNLDSSINRNTNDEIGDLEEIFAQTQVNLKAIISDIASVLHEISNKNLTVKTSTTYQGDFIQIQDSLQGIITSMNHTMNQVRIAADQVDAGSNQVSVGAQALAQGASEQASYVEELSTTVQTISDKVNHTAEHAEFAHKQTIATKDSLDRSSQKMKDLIVAMNQIKDTSGQIQGIIKTIDDIAYQTNILALNAAIEAARAGEAGKGFAVVADEVRNLAGKSAEASRTTQELIEASIQAVEKGNEMVSATAKELSETATDANIVVTSITEIAQDSMEEAKSVSDVTAGLGQISNVVQTNAATAEESAASSEELSGQASILRNLINEFQFAEHFVKFDSNEPPRHYEETMETPLLSAT